MTTTAPRNNASLFSWEHHAGWARALSLRERLALSHASGCEAHLPAFDAQRADLRVRRWRKQPPFEKEEIFAAYLAQAGLDEAALHALSGESAEALSQRVQATPDWVKDLMQIFVAPSPEGVCAASLLATLGAAAPHQAALLSLFSPLLNSAEDLLRAGITELTHTFPDFPCEIEQVCQAFLQHFAMQILSQTMRVLTLELRVAQAEERLQGETSEERLQHFVTLMQDSEAQLAFLEEYAPLARSLMLLRSHWLKFALEFLHHLCVDWDTLCREIFAGQAPGKLIHVSCGEGDVHKQGRSTLALSFASGAKLIYKPRSMAVDCHFQELLLWLNERGDHLSFRLTRVINRGKYGWSEFIPTTPCASAEELARFYERQGGYLALFYALEMIDVHYENLIASGEHPVMIDLESLLHPRLSSLSSDLSDPASAQMANSVLRIGMLPYRLFGNQQQAGVDISGLGGQGGQLAPKPTLYLKDLGTDHAHFVRERFPMSSQRNMPTLAGETADLLDYQEQLIDGFVKIYRLLLRERVALMAGPLQAFAHAEIRVIVRATRTYGKILTESSHPDLLRDSLERDRFFAQLWTATAKRPSLQAVVAYEVADLHEGDIPFFTSRPDTRAIYSSCGVCIPDFLEQPSLETVKERLLMLDEQDLERQLWVIRASLATRFIDKFHQIVASGSAARPARQMAFAVPMAARRATSEVLLQTACAVGDRLSTLALIGEQKAYWLSLELINEREWVVIPAQADLYTGIGGTCFFLAYLGQISGRTKYTQLARQALATIRDKVDTLRDSLQSVGGYSGWGALIYLYTHLAMLWHDETLLEEAQKFAGHLAEHIGEDEDLDVISGSAGAIAALLSLYEVRADPEMLALAKRCGEHLLSQAIQCSYQPGNVVQPVTKPIPASQPLAGFSHGAAGIALNLLRLASVSGEARFRAGALACMAYERQVFSAEQGNWPDFRLSDDGTPAQEPSFMSTWCHGAPGVALARLAGLEYLDDAAVREEIAVALQTTLRCGFGSNHSLCHGDLGNLECFLMSARVLDEPHYLADLERLTDQILANIEQYGWRAGVPLGVEIPGLMTGIAGIGYQLLRLANPESVPAVLTLAAPINH